MYDFVIMNSWPVFHINTVYRGEVTTDGTKPRVKVADSSYSWNIMALRAMSPAYMIHVICMYTGFYCKKPEVINPFTSAISLKKSSLKTLLSTHDLD